LMAVGVAAVPAVGGLGELAAKALVGLVIYASGAYALDLCGLRGHSGRLVRALQARGA
jgi:hypothetical protein